MSSGTSNESSNLVSGLGIGIAAFSVFGFITYVLLSLSSLKSPADRIAAGDFSKELQNIRAEVSSAAKKSQSEAFNEEKVVAAMANFKAAPQSDSSVPVPGLAVEEQPQPEVVPVETPSKSAAKKATPADKVEEPAADKAEEPADKAEEAPKRRKRVNKAEGKQN